MKYRGTEEDWQKVTVGVDRLRVHGGWLVRLIGSEPGDYAVEKVDDPRHEWAVEKMER